MTSTVPYSVRVPKPLLEEMKRHYDRIEPPKPTFSAILSHIMRLGWQAYVKPIKAEPAISEAVMPQISKSFSTTRVQVRQ